MKAVNLSQTDRSADSKVDVKIEYQELNPTGSSQALDMLQCARNHITTLHSKYC